MDLAPLKNNRDFRFLYGAQFIAFFGAMLTFVALPYQMYQLTHSTLAVGLISIAELIPTVIMAFMIGGSLCMVGIVVCTLLLPGFWAYYRGEIIEA